ncbi:hypothetical protein AbraIFM66950_003385 [Aspergillus brasiliensis]|nr:hypothetical protein AbraIFM66950_003385 [Aspergillus brasiliensis]
MALHPKFLGQKLLAANFQQQPHTLELSGAAVLRLAPDKFWEFSAALFNHQEEFFDVSVVNETRNKTYQRLAEIAATVGVDQHEMLELLIISEVIDDGRLNTGNKVTNDIKLMVKVRH